MSTTPNYNVNYEDERFKEVEAERDQALTEVDQQYGEMIGNTDKYYQDLINQSKEYTDKQVAIQNENRDFAIEKIEQQREQAKKDYTKEQSGAYVDWQKQSNAYGVQAEKMAEQGLAGSGYSESSQVAMFTAYQNRVASARNTMAQANMNFDNGIKEAILQNNSIIAEIYAKANKEQLEIALEGFKYKNDLLENQMNREMQLKQFYSNEWQNVLNQINTENALAEEVRQANMQQAQWEKEYQQKLAEFEEQKRQFDVEIERLKAQDKAEAEYKAQQLAMAKRELELEEDKFKAEQEAYRIAQQSSGGSSKTSKAVTATAKVTQGAVSAIGSALKNAFGGGSKDTSYVQAPYKVCTPYWRGGLNEGVSKYGAFATDYATTPYQPKGVVINGKDYGKVTSTGKKVAVTSTVKYGNDAGKKKTSQQTVWKTPDGKKWLWNGTANKYERYYG